jgi:E3 ubiquitin-protein ligase HERC2
METMKLFIKSPNHANNVGSERDKYVPNPQTTSEKDLQNYFKLGTIMALCIRCSEVLNFDFPSIFWKYLMRQEL